MSVSQPRVQLQKFLSVEQGEGQGARVRRSIGRRELTNVDPFLMLDEFKGALPAGFPDHPHRGFETVSYVLPTSKGRMTHEDSNGHKGIIGPGDLQWMTAGKGILHSEVPESRDLCHGLQLWLNLPAKDKMMEPMYQEILHTELSHVEKDGIHAIVIAGTALDTTSKVKTRIPVQYIHFLMQKGAQLSHAIPKDYTAFAYTLDGVVDFGKGPVEAHHTVTFGDGDGIHVNALSDNVSFVVLGARPIGEPVAQMGPFVMNTQKELDEAVRNFRNGVNGFEKSQTWQSQNRLLMQ